MLLSPADWFEHEPNSDHWDFQQQESVRATDPVLSSLPHIDSSRKSFPVSFVTPLLQRMWTKPTKAVHCQHGYIHFGGFLE